ncbi:hypothetical protein BH23ACT11_BH23ACT11_13110 [soil metagenome]
MDLSRQPTPAEQHHRNSGLFSDHYLNVTLPHRTVWQQLAPEAEKFMEELADIFAAYTPSNNEAQTEADLVRPVLRALGHDFEVQASLQTPEGTKKPDYVLYKNAESLAANKNLTLDEELLSGKSFAVGDAKYWDRPLDVALKDSKKDSLTNNPSYQIFFYMQHAGTAWGILTNGRRWRLYHHDTAHKLDRFYEVDLQELVESDDVEKFLYFYAFFRRAAFDDDPLSVASILRASEDYARGVGDSLKGQVYEALRHIAQGFLDYPANGLGPEPDKLPKIYDNSLIVLYRMLFVLYAEARELLPVRGSELYRESYSLHRIKHDVVDGPRLLKTSGKLWNDLKELFHSIDKGNPPLSVATFNGGLFDPARHPFLEEHAVGDAHLQGAIDRLSRVKGEFVDYRDLAERHLGTIYEGLLEFHLETLDEPEESWTVALVNDNGERKATGSYYTPDFVVKYIVEASVGPMLRAAAEGAATAEAKVEAVLALDVLDPAMGSGHFLVEVTEYIARFLVALDVAPDEIAEAADAEAELAYWKRRVVQSCVYGVDMNPLAVDLAKLSLWLSTVARDRPLSFLDHHLRTGNSLVGARLTELQPGNTGGGKKRKNTAKPSDDSQLSMLADDAFRQSMSLAVGSMWVIEESPAASVEDVKQQEQLYERLREDLTRRYTRLADLVTATRFGVEVDPTLWRPLADYATSKNVATLPQFQRWLDEAREIAAGQRFFHWELEFPEVFFDRHGKPLGDEAGFDAVVGNPPYVRQEALGPVKPYFKEAYAETYHGVADLYVYFYQLGLRQLRRGGRMSYIVTNKWLRAGYGEPLRGYFAEEDALVEILDFGHAPIFPDADVFPCIVVLQKRGSTTKDDETDGEVRVAAVPREELGGMDLDRTVEAHAHTVPRERFGRDAWSLESSAVDDLIAKIRRNGVPLAEFAGVKPAYGIKTGLNEAFLIDTATKAQLVREDPASAEVIKPYLRGQDIKRWSPNWQDLWMIVLKSSGDHAWPWSDAGEDAEEVFRQTYPSLHAHMEPLEEKLRKRQDHGRYWWELRPCAYYRAFEQAKLVVQRIAFHPRIALDEGGTCINDSAILLPTADPWLLACLNSPANWYFTFRYMPHKKDEALAMDIAGVEKLPIAPPTGEARAEAEEAVGRLVEITRAEQESRRDALDWLRVEYGVEKPGQKLSDFAALTGDEFVEEVRKRRPKGSGRLSPAGLKELRSGYTDLATPVREGRTEAAKLERRLSDLVNQAYGLIPEEVDLLWATAPPRMPGF